MRVFVKIVDSTCMCGRENRGYHHKTTEAGKGCGLCNDIQIEEEHNHYYCTCGRSHTIDTNGRRIDSHARLGLQSKRKA